jgi:hypothetical protein
MFVTIITDCCDDNARTRQETRYAHLFPGVHISFLGAENDIEASGNVIDVLDASDDAPGIIAVNCAPRNGRAKKWQNGSPFGYCWVGKKLIVGTIDGLCFGFIKRFGLADEIHVTDIQTVLEFAKHTPEQVETGVNTQFRSLNYLPRLAKIVWEHKNVPSEIMPISEVPDMPPVIWWVDSFGNCKTTITENELDMNSKEDKVVTFADGTHIKAPCVEKLAEVPDGSPALTAGSSGLRDHRFVELVIQGASAADRFALKKTDSIEIS